MSPSTYPRNVIFCALDIYDKVKKAFPKRNVVPEPHCNERTFHYFGRNGQVREVRIALRMNQRYLPKQIVELASYEIYAPDKDKGFPHMKRIR